MNRGLAGQRDDAKALLCASCTLLLGCHRNEERVSLGSLGCLHCPGLLHMFRRLLHPLPSLTPESAVSNALPSRCGSPSGRRRKPASCQSGELRASRQLWRSWLGGSPGGAGALCVQRDRGWCRAGVLVLQTPTSKVPAGVAVWKPYPWDWHVPRSACP